MSKCVKIVSLLLLIVIITTALMGCRNTKDNNAKIDPVVMSYNDKTITASEFGYYLSKYKSQFAKVYSDFEDTDEFYNSKINGMEAEDYLFDMVVQNVKRTLVSEVLFEENGLEMTDAIVGDIEYYIDLLIYEKFGNDDAAFNEAVSKLGITALQLRNIYLRDEMTFELLSSLSKTKEIIGVTEESMQNYLEENYARICHIYVNNKYTYLTDSNGKPVYDGEGKIMTVAMSGKELATKNAVVDAIDESLEEGGDFIEVYDAFSEDKLYKNGYYLTKNTPFIDEVVNAAFAIEVGEWVKIESTVGTHYVKRLVMDKAPWKDATNGDFLSTFETTVINEFFGSYLDSFADNVVVNEEILKEFDLRKVETNYIF